MKYNMEAAERLYREAVLYGLSGAELLADSQAVMRDCNGVGADWMPDAMANACTKLNPVMELPAAIHDRHYANGKTRQERADADLEFLTNTIKVIHREYAWWRPKRYIMMRRAMRYYSYLVMFGGKAWEEARKK